MSVIGSNANIDNDVKIGYPLFCASNNLKYPIIGNNCIIRSGTIIYCDVVIGDNFKTGHNVLIRESTLIGDDVLIGTATIIDGKCIIGDNTKIQSGVYIPPETFIGENVFIAPKVTFTNDKYPPLKYGKLDGAIVQDGATIGANSTILPSIIIGEGAFVAAGSVVTRNVPEYMMAIGNPARIKELPEMMRCE
jgi:UDP-3-O-[3-hydroxymyristoyl] glucosamine N-acyltransferase